MKWEYQIVCNSFFIGELHYLIQKRWHWFVFTGRWTRVREVPYWSPSYDEVSDYVKEQYQKQGWYPTTGF